MCGNRLVLKKAGVKRDRCGKRQEWKEAGLSL